MAEQQKPLTSKEEITSGTNKGNSLLYTSSVWVSKSIMWAIFILWVASVFFLPFDFFDNIIWSRWTKLTTGTIFGITGTIFLCFSGPVLLIAFLGFLHITIFSRDDFKKENMKSPKFRLRTLPVFVGGPFGVVSAAEFIGILLFSLYVTGSMIYYIKESYGEVQSRSTSLSLKNSFLLEQIGLRFGSVGLFCLMFLFLPVARGSILLRLTDIPFEHAARYHVWLGHLTTVLFTLHGFFYVVAWTLEWKLLQRKMTGVEISNKFATHNKPDPFKGDGDCFTTWQNKMLFYITTLSLQKCLEEEEPKPAVGQTKETHKDVFFAIDAWKHSDFLCRNYILNCLDSMLYKVYQPHQTAKGLWTALAEKYKIQNVSLKKFVVDKFMDYEMVDSKSVTAQVQELQIIIHELESERHKVSESFLVEAITGKLPPSWKDYRHYLKHKKKKISLQDLIVKLKIEADNRGVTQPKDKEAFVAEGPKKGGNFKRKNFQQKRPAPENMPNKNKQSKKFNGQCWVCGKSGHAAKDCRNKKEGNQEAHVDKHMEVDESHFSA